MIFCLLVAKTQPNLVFTRLIENSLVRCIVIPSKAKSHQILLAEILRYAQYDRTHWHNDYNVTTVTLIGKH